MVTVSRETAAETHERLRSVIARAEISMLGGVWSFSESPIDEPPSLNPETLAVTHDDTSWCALRRVGPQPNDDERFGLFSFHFPPDLDNSGFVGWLATELKTRLGTGVFVICGSNRDQGGIYDYWGVPIELFERVEAVLRDLAAPSATTGSDG